MSARSQNSRPGPGQVPTRLGAVTTGPDPLSELDVGLHADDVHYPSASGIDDLELARQWVTRVEDELDAERQTFDSDVAFSAAIFGILFALAALVLTMEVTSAWSRLVLMGVWLAALVSVNRYLLKVRRRRLQRLDTMRTLRRQYLIRMSQLQAEQRLVDATTALLAIDRSAPPTLFARLRRRWLTRR